MQATIIRHFAGTVFAGIYAMQAAIIRRFASTVFAGIYAMLATIIRHFAGGVFCRRVRGWRHWRKKREGEVDERRDTVLQALVRAELEIAVRQAAIAKQRQQVREVRDVLGVVEKERVEQRRRLRFLPLEVNLDELAAGEAVLAVNAEKTLTAFQLEIRESEQVLERPEFLKEVEALDGVEAVKRGRVGDGGFVRVWTVDTVDTIGALLQRCAVMRVGCM